MSIKLSGFILDTELPPTETLLLLALNDYADQDGRCWPSKETLARRSRVSKRTVDKYLKRLADDDWLKIDVSHGGRRSNIYIINIEKIETEGDLKNEIPCKPCRGAMQPMLQGCHATHVAPEPPIEVKKHRQQKTPPPRQQKKTSPHHWFVSWWCFAYQQVVDQKYAITKKDAGQVANLIKRLELEELTARACAYLALPSEKRFPRGSPTLGGLLCQINEVASGFDAALEQRFVGAGLLPDFDQIDNLTDFQPWRKTA